MADASSNLGSCSACVALRRRAIATAIAAALFAVLAAGAAALGSLAIDWIPEPDRAERCHAENALSPTGSTDACVTACASIPPERGGPSRLVGGHLSDRDACIARCRSMGAADAAQRWRAEQVCMEGRTDSHGATVMWIVAALLAVYAIVRSLRLPPKRIAPAATPAGVYRDASACAQHGVIDRHP